MRKSIYSLALLTILLIGGLVSFKPIDNPLPTKMRITVIDGLGNIVEGAKVTLYLKEEDYRNSTNALTSGETDKKGRVLFKDLQPVSYFIDARKNDMNNDGKGAKSAVLLEGRINTVNTVIE